MKPVRLFLRSLRQFARGFAPALGMAFVCLALQRVVSRVLVIGWGAVAPEKPDRPLGYTGPWDWREDVWDALYSALDASVLFFFHALVALIVTAWLLRSRAGFEPLRVLRRAASGAAVLACAAAVVFAAAYLVDDALPATRYVRFNFSAAAMVALWFGASALLLPARLMGHEPAAAAGFVRTTVVAALALLPWFYITEMLGAPLRHCYDDCGGMFFAGLDYLAFLGAYLLGLTVSSAAVSAAACLPTDPRANRLPAATSQRAGRARSDGQSAFVRAIASSTAAMARSGPRARAAARRRSPRRGPSPRSRLSNSSGARHRRCIGDTTGRRS